MEKDKSEYVIVDKSEVNDSETKFKKSNSNISTNTTNSKNSKKNKESQFIEEQYEAIAPIDIKTSELVLSVAMRKDYPETILSTIIDITNHDEDMPGFGDYPYFRVNQVIKFIPKLDTESDIFSERQLKELHMQLPYYQKYKNLKLLYSSSKHGISMKTFYLNTEGYKNTIMIIKDEEQHIFGGYLSEPIRNSQKFYGTGESFVFTYHNSERIHVYQSTMKNEYFIYSDFDLIAMGCDDKSFAFVVREDFLKGSSRPTSTFNNPTLANNEDYFIVKFEVWTFDE